MRNADVGSRAGWGGEEMYRGTRGIRRWKKAKFGILEIVTKNTDHAFDAHSPGTENTKSIRLSRGGDPTQDQPLQEA